MRPSTLALLTLLLTACGRGCADLAGPADGPPRGAAALAPAPVDRSVITAPITMPIAVIRAQVLAKVPKVIVDSEGEEVKPGILADIHVERTDEPTVSAADGALRIEVPVRARVSVRPKLPNLPPPPKAAPPLPPPPPKGPPGLPPRPPRPGAAAAEASPPPPPAKGPTAELDASLRILVELRPELGADWRLTPHVTLTHTWTRPPVVSLGPIEVNLGDKADAPIREKLAEAQAKLNEDLAKEIDVASQVRGLWDQLAGAHPLPADKPGAPPAWLSFAPDALFASPIRVDRDGIHLVAGVAGQLQVVVADTAPVTPKPALPPRSEPPANTGAKIRSRLELAWPTLRSTLATAIEGQAVTQALPTGGEAKVELLRLIDVYPSGTAIAAGVELRVTAASTPTNLTIWLSGTPRVDGDTLRVADFQFAADSDRALVDAANAATADTVRAAIAERLVVPLAGPQADALAQLNHGLENGPADAPARIGGAMTRAALTGVDITDAALVVSAVIEGDLTVELRR
jgi:hypothetical protein